MEDFRWFQGSGSVLPLQGAQVWFLVEEPDPTRCTAQNHKWIRKTERLCAKKPATADHTKINSEWITDLNAKPKRIKKKNLKMVKMVKFILYMHAKSLSHVQLFVTPWTIAH